MPFYHFPWLAFATNIYHAPDALISLINAWMPVDNVLMSLVSMPLVNIGLDDPGHCIDAPCHCHAVPWSLHTPLWCHCLDVLGPCLVTCNCFYASGLCPGHCHDAPSYSFAWCAPWNVLISFLTLPFQEWAVKIESSDLNGWLYAKLQLFALYPFSFIHSSYWGAISA